MDVAGDLHSITTHDGRTEYFPSNTQAFIDYGGYGAPPLTYQVRQGYLQHGATMLNYVVQPRPIALTIWANDGCTMLDYCDMRARLHDLLRPNRKGPMILTLQQPGGALRSIKARANPGLEFANPDDNAQALVQGVELLAHDPIWYDPTAHNLASLATVANTQLVFPITFPITFGETNTIYTTGAITYVGTWEARLIVTINGPATWLILRNNVTGNEVTLLVPFPAGEQRVLTFDNGELSVMDGNGNGKFADLGVNSDLEGFGLLPDPEVPGGVQTLLVSIAGASAGTSVSVEYYDRYFAI